VLLNFNFARGNSNNNKENKQTTTAELKEKAANPTANSTQQRSQTN